MERKQAGTDAKVGRQASREAAKWSINARFTRYTAMTHGISHNVSMCSQPRACDATELTISSSCAPRLLHLKYRPSGHRQSFSDQQFGCAH